jgi:hypothetical protein
MIAHFAACLSIGARWREGLSFVTYPSGQSNAEAPKEGVESMITRKVTLPELGMVAGTRVALGAGIGLLLANKLSDEQRRAVGVTLLLVGIVSTLPLALEVLGKDE